jgi:hypothetical protein
MAAAAATQYGIPPDIFASLIQQESGWRPDVISSAGAIGPAQLMPGTAEELGVDPYDPAQNIEGGARYLAQQYERFGSWPLALAAYNAGPGAVTRYGGIPPFAETQAYVPAVLGRVGGTDPMAMTPDPEQQPQGFFGRVGQGLGELFPAFRAAPDSSPTDPFEGLSRNQRMMLGFASIRDAAEALQGRQSSHFREALGGFEDARERERLRRQGELANRAAALQGLAQVQQQIAIARASNVAPSPAQIQLEQYFTEMLTSGGGGLGGTAPVAPTATPLPEIVPTGGGAAPEPSPMGEPAGQAQGDVPLEDSLARLQGQLSQLAALGASPAQMRGVEQDIEIIMAQIEARDAATQEAERATIGAETRSAGAGRVLETVGDLRAAIQENPALTTGLGSRLLSGLPGSAALDAEAMAQTIRANVGFDTLQEMRDTSPTGGALGQVSERELKDLQATIGSLRLDQSPERIMATLDNIERQYQTIIRRAYETTEDRAALDNMFGGTPSFVEGGGGSPAAPPGEIQFNLN